MTGIDGVELAQRALARAARAGAAAADSVVVEGDVLEARVRGAEIEFVKQARERRLGLRVFAAGPGGLRTAVTSSSDLSSDAVDRLAAETVALARATAPDPLGRPSGGRRRVGAARPRAVRAGRPSVRRGRAHRARARGGSRRARARPAHHQLRRHDRVLGVRAHRLRQQRGLRGQLRARAPLAVLRAAGPRGRGDAARLVDVGRPAPAGSRAAAGRRSPRRARRARAPRRETHPDLRGAGDLRPAHRSGL